MESYRDDLLHYVQARVRNLQEAEDIVQQAMLQVYACKKEIEFVRAYLFQTAAHILAHRKKRVPIAFEQSTLEEIMPGVEMEECHSDEIEKLHCVLTTLKPKERELLQSVYFDGDSREVTSKKLGISIDNVYTSLGRTLKKLQQSMMQ